MRRARRWRALGRQHRVEQRRIIGERAAEAGVDLGRPVLQQRRQRLAAAGVAPIAVLRRERRERGAMRDDKVGQRRVAAKRAQWRERRAAIGEQGRRGGPVGVGEALARGMGVRLALRRAPGRERRRRVGESVRRQDNAQDADLERPRRVVERRRRAAEPSQSVAKHRDQLRRGEVARRRERQPSEYARLRLAKRASGGGFDVDPPTRKLGGDAPRDRCVGGDQRGGAAGRLERFAHRAGERQGLLVFVGGDDDRHAGERAFNRRFREPVVGALAAPGVGRVGWAQRLTEKTRASAERRVGFAERRRRGAVDADDLEQPMENRLRVAGDADRVALRVAEQRPGGVVEAAIEIGQHDRALRRARDRRHQSRRGAIGAGRAGDNCRPASGLGGERLDLGVDRQRRAARAVDEAALSEPIRPAGEGDLEEVEGDAPIGIEAVGDQIVQPLGVDALDDEVVDQAGEVAGQRESLRRTRRHQRRFGGVERERPVGADAADRAFERLTPGARQSGQSQSPRQIADRRRDLLFGERAVRRRIERVAARF